MQIECRKRIAKLTSATLNPFLVSLVMIVLLSFKSTSSTFDALKWSLILIAFSILPVFSAIVYLVRRQRLDGIFINARKQRNNIYLLASVCAVVGFLVLSYLEAPLILRATFVAGLSMVVIFMCINLLWKISVHTAFVTASITILIILYGAIGAVATALLPLMAWARIELKRHSPAQVVIGSLLAALIVVVVFYLFGLVEPATPV